MNMLRLTSEIITPIDGQTELENLLWRAGRDAPVREREAIAAVAMNRARLLGAASVARSAEFATSLGVACQGLEDSVANVENASDDKRQDDKRQDDRIRAYCKRIARRAVMGVLEDPTKGATNFHRESTCPAWSRGYFPCAWFGARLFYKLED
ncbi:MAG: cell wall hydrolase [Alphaproteobacteria bacterium]|nr:cell wall hydrolase [Alphaproteobacteria bacterium]